MQDDWWTNAEDSSSALVFGSFRLEADGTLYRDGSKVELPPAELAVLRLLLTHAGQVVTPAQVRDAVDELRSGPNAVAECVASLSARLGRGNYPGKYIEGVYKRGYRFSAEVRPGGAVPSRSGVFRSADPGTQRGESPHDHPLRLAIIPLSTATGVPEHMGSAIAEEMALLLGRSHFSALDVLAQESVAALAERVVSAQQLGKYLRADLVLTGVIRFLPADYRIHIVMLRVTDGAELWSEDLAIDRARGAEMAGELATRVGWRLNLPLPIGAAVGEVASKPTPQQLEAWELLQRGRYEIRSLERHQMQDGLQRLTRATELDPALTEARVELANVCVIQEMYGYMPAIAAADTVRRAAAGAPDAVLPALAWVQFHFDRNLPAALAVFERLSDLPYDPRNIRAHVMFELSRHRFPQAISLLRAALQLDPWSAWLNATLAWALHLAGDPASVEQAEYALKEFPDRDEPALHGTAILAYNGQTERAVHVAEDLTHRRPYSDPASAACAYALACAGQAARAREILEQLDWLSRERYLLNSFMAAAYVALGEHDQAMEQLRAADRDRCPWFFQMLADPCLAPLRGRPDFQELQAILARMESDSAQS